MAFAKKFHQWNIKECHWDYFLMHKHKGVFISDVHKELELRDSWGFMDFFYFLSQGSRPPPFLNIGHHIRKTLYHLNITSIKTH